MHHLRDEAKLEAVHVCGAAIVQEQGVSLFWTFSHWTDVDVSGEVAVATGASAHTFCYLKRLAGLNPRTGSGTCD